VKTRYRFQAGIFHLVLILCGSAERIYAEQDHSSHQMSVSKHGIVMNNNHHNLPWGCQEISEDIEFEVFAGREYARLVPGMVFGMSKYEYHVKTCARITVKFTNKDSVRHQWMVHGLPRKLYPGGMFHLEAMAGQSVEGTFIVPDANKTYLVHCDMSQHMEKGMKGQLIVGSGSGNLWGISGVSSSFRRSDYLPKYSLYFALVILASGFLFGVYILRRQ